MSLTSFTNVLTSLLKRFNWRCLLALYLRRVTTCSSHTNKHAPPWVTLASHPRDRRYVLPRAQTPELSHKSRNYLKLHYLNAKPSWNTIEIPYDSDTLRIQIPYDWNILHPKCVKWEMIACCAKYQNREWASESDIALVPFRRKRGSLVCRLSSWPNWTVWANRYFICMRGLARTESITRIPHGCGFTL